MTVHIFISLLTLFLLLWTLRRLTNVRQPGERVGWFPFSLMILSLLPMSFGPIVPLSHFVFVITDDNVLWFDIVYGSLWILTGFFLWRYKTRYLNLAVLVVYVTMWGILGFWGFLGATLSEYEPGRKTPALTDASIYMQHWASVQLLLLCLFGLLFFSPEHSRSWKRIIIGCLLFAIYLAITVSGIETSDLVRSIFKGRGA